MTDTEQLEVVIGFVWVVGPTWRGLWGSNRTFVDGTTRVADENYLTQSIRAPQSQVVQGFTRANMPVYNPTENRRLALIAYIRLLAVEVTGASSEGLW